MLPPQEYEKARKKARYHLQVSVDHVPNNVMMPCANLCIKGKVVCIFRGRRSIRIGDSVEFDVAVQGEPYIAMASGIIWLNYSNLLQANYMEVFLNGKPPNCSIALCQYELIEAPTKDLHFLLHSLSGGTNL